MAPQLMYRVDGDNVVSRQSVVSGTGFVVGKDYKPKELHQGDIGIHIRLDLGKLDGEMTPEQRAAAARMFRDAVQEVGVVLGENLRPGFRPGVIVREADGDCISGVVEYAMDNGIMLRRFNFQGKEITSFIPLTHRIDEVPGYVGMDGFLKAIAYGEINPESVEAMKAIIARIDDENMLVQILNPNSPCPYSPYFSAIYAQVIEKINSPQHLARIIGAFRPIDEGLQIRSLAAKKISATLPTLASEQCEELIAILEPTVDCTFQAEHRQPSSAKGYLIEEDLTILFMDLLRRCGKTEKLSYMAIDDRCATAIRLSIIETYLDFDALKEFVFSGHIVCDVCSNEHVCDGRPYQCERAIAVINRFPNDDPYLVEVLKRSRCGATTQAALEKIYNPQSLQDVLAYFQVHGIDRQINLIIHERFGQLMQQLHHL